MSDLDDFKATFFDECSELLGELEEQFAAIEAGDRTANRLNAVFRAVHSIKGGGGAFGFVEMVAFAHAYETLLDHVRDGRIELSDPVTVLCIRANDLLADFVKAARTGASLGPGYGADERAQFDALTRGEPIGSHGGDAGGAPMDEFDIDFVPVMVDLAPSAAAAPAPAEDSFANLPLTAERGHWEIHFAPHSELYSRANDPLLLFRELGNLGELTVTAKLGEIPPLADFEPYGIYCSWELTLVSPTATAASIAEVFEFVEGNCDLSIALLAGANNPPAEPTLDELAALVMPPVADDGPGLSFADLAETLKTEAPVRAPAAAPILLRPAEPAPMSAAEESDADRRGGEADRRTAVQSIRVDLDKVDRVVNMVGELVITQSMLTQQMDDTLRARYQELVRGLEVLAQTTRGLQDAVMAIRAQPVKSVFSRMPRLVRDLAQKTGKKIKLETIGEATEIDKTVIEQLSDPLTHMIRNSCDHGIETPEARRALGKPEIGTIRLSAEQAGGNILIAVEDDGGGINRDRVLQVARDRLVIGPDQQLTEEQIDNLIFAPGFSTATEVSDISGRGVGMDVVLSNIKKIGGSVHVRSRTGQGTRMTLRLPLTLAVLDVMLVRVGPSPYVVPLSSIVETIQCSRADFGRAPSGAKVLRVRGEYVQVVDLAERFELTGGAELANRFVVLCEAEGGTKVALVVDDIIGQQQVVIKSLEENFESIDGIAGGTILGDGNVALIVDVQGLKAQKLHKNAA
ncbi:MAG: chemotaxis protein CheA [Devosia nanyangense]|uniref:Chemotaxis protein CheA n=1 Tax=Devosia nanyangense TaxID=1228055 RepID=A0A933KYI1_9HYPH|nr:chemotaxis protein CheA [Devosia nanyangense]